MSEGYVIIGNSTAGIACVEGIRSLDKSTPITIITDERHYTYARPLISYLLKGDTTRKKIRYRPDDFYEKNNVKLVYDLITKIDTEQKKVLSDEYEYPYDKLLVATGSKPFVPNFKGIESVPSVHTFLTLDSALAIDDMVDKKHVLIIGAGLIGLKCAEGIAERASHITIVDMADQVLPTALDKASAHIIQKIFETHNVRFILNASVENFEGKKAILTTGEAFEFDMVVIAVGVRPNTELIMQAGGNVDRGILIDEHMATSLPDIYSAGDCTQTFDIASQTSRVLALLPVAYKQGNTAGINIAGGNQIYDNAFAMNASGFFGDAHYVSAGSYEGEAFVESSDGTYKKLVTKDNRLKGFIIIGDIESAGIYTSLIRDQVPLDEIDFEKIKQKPQLHAFSRERIKSVFGTNKV
jgi:NAD(P)H-nitrite reductase large subunit